MELTCTFSSRRMILLLMLFWNMLWGLLGVRMVCSLSLSLVNLGTPFLPPLISTSSNDVFLPTRPSTGRCSLRYYVPKLKANLLRRSNIPSLRCTDIPSTSALPPTERPSLLSPNVPCPFSRPSPFGRNR